MGCASSVPAESSLGKGSTQISAKSTRSRESVDTANLQRIARGVSRNPEASALVSVNLIDFLADQMGESDPKASLAASFRELYAVIFDEDWDADKLSAEKISALDDIVLGQLQTLFKQGPKLSSDMICWKYDFKMDQAVPERSLDLKGRVGVNFPQCTLVHAFCALGFVRSLDFVLAHTRLIASPKKRGLKVAMHSPLETAARFGRLEVAKLLVEEFEVNPLETLLCGDPEAKGLLSTRVSPLIRAVADGRANTTLYFLELGADPMQSVELHGQTRSSLVRLAIGRALNDYAEVVRVLIEHGASPDVGLFTERFQAVDMLLESPLMTAAKLRDVDLMRMLIDLGADITVSNQQTQASLLHVAASVPGNTKVLAYVLSMNEHDILAADISGATPWLAAKDISHADEGENQRALSDFARDAFRAQRLRKPESKHVRKPASFVDAPRAVEGVATGDFVALTVTYRFHRLAKGALRTQETFWARVQNVHSDSVDVEIAEVLALCHNELDGANLGDTLLGVPATKLQRVSSAIHCPREHDDEDE